MTGPRPPKRGTKTREVLETFENDERQTARDVANRVSFVPVKNDASAVNPFLRNLVQREYLDVEDNPGWILYHKTLKGRVETEMVERGEAI